jgi:hypothetical protein
MPEAKTESTDIGFVDEVRERFKQSKTHSNKWRKEAKDSYDFVAGHQWTDQEQQELEEDLRAAITFNRIGPVIDSVSGHQVNNRQDIRYSPRRVGDSVVNEILTGAVKWCDDESDASDEISDAFWDLLVSGMGWTETRISYDEDLDGKIHSAERVPSIEMYWDSSARKRNLADAQYVMRGRWIPRKEAEARWPKAKQLEPNVDEMWVEDTFDEPHDAQNAWKYEPNNSSDWYNENKDEIFILQYQWYERQPVWRVVDPISGELVEIDDSKYQKIKDQIADLPQARQIKKKFYQAFLAGPMVLEKGDCPCPDHFTLRCMTGKRDQNRNTFYGLVRGMIDPQRWSNKFFSEIQDIMVSNRTGGAFVEETALVNAREAEEQWNQANPLIMVRDGAISRGAIMERNPIQYPAGLDRLMNFAVSSIRDVSGVNLELMGLVDRQQAGVLEAQRKQAGMTILSTFFDSLRRYQKERGRVMMYFVKEYLADGRLIKIVGGDGLEQYVPLIMEDDTLKYDVVVDQSPTSTSQKEETWAVLQQLAPLLLKAGAPIPPDALDYLPLPASLVSKWKEMLVQRMQSAEQDPEQMAKMMETQAKAQKDQSTAELNAAKAQEIQAKNIQNQSRAAIDAEKIRQGDRKLSIDERKVANEEAETTSKIYERASNL